LRLHRRSAGLFFFAIAAALLVGVSACESLVTDPVPYGKIHVRAVGRDSAPLPGIRVELYTGFAPHGYHTTDANGRTTFSRVPVQQYGIAVNPGPNYGLLQDILPQTSRTSISGINVTAATDTVFSFVFTRKGPGAIEVRVEDQDSLPVVGVKVGLYNFMSEVETRLSNLNGIARFEPVPYGNWGVYVEPPDSNGITGPRQHMDGLAIELGTVHTPRFEVSRCAGTINVSVFDQDSVPVAGYPLQLYTFLGAYRYLATADNGVAIFANTPCGNYGVIAEPHAGFSVSYTRGSGFQDGLSFTNAGAVSTQLRVTRN
jgi:hypothetical protein